MHGENGGLMELADRGGELLTDLVSALRRKGSLRGIKLWYSYEVEESKTKIGRTGITLEIKRGPISLSITGKPATEIYSAGFWATTDRRVGTFSYTALDFEGKELRHVGVFELSPYSIPNSPFSDVQEVVRKLGEQTREIIR